MKSCSALTLVGYPSLASTAAAQTPSSFPADAYAQLAPGKAHKPEAFPWPSLPKFRSTWNEANDARLIRVLHARWTTEEGPRQVLLGIVPQDDRYHLFVLGIDGDRDAEWKAQRQFQQTAVALERKGEILTVHGEDESTELTVLGLSEGGHPSATGLWTDWTYLSVLLETNPAKDGEFRIPRGVCSMDTSPAAAAREHAQTCFEAGRIGCFLEFQIRIMGDQFRRTAYSSYGERAHETQSKFLLATGIDLKRLFRGLLSSYITDKPRRAGLGTWRLARAIAELEAPDVTTAIRAIAEDSGVDEYNRLSATMVFAYAKIAQAHHEQRPVEINAVVEAVRKEAPNLSWSSKVWLAILESQ